MRRLLLAGVIVLVVLLTVYRQRVFLRDPLGRVERNGVVQDGARVFINYSNDVLIASAGGRGFLLVQGWHGGAPGVPAVLRCVSGMICWTDANQATMAALGGRSRAGAMSSREVSFTDAEGDGVKVTLR